MALRGSGCDAEVVLEESFTWRDDQQVRWSRHGSGPPLVFCHGTPWRSALWNRIADALSSDFTVYLLARHPAAQRIATAACPGRTSSAGTHDPLGAGARRPR